jgi:hypothetical protein
MLTHRTAEPGSPGDRPSRFTLTRRSRAVFVLAAAVAALAPLTVPAAAQATITTTIAVGAFPEKSPPTRPQGWYMSPTKTPTPSR